MAGLPGFSSSHTAIDPRSRRLVGDFLERIDLGELAAGCSDVGAIALEAIGDRAAKVGISDAHSRDTYPF